MKRIIWVLLGALIFLAGCSLPKIGLNKRIISHPAPQMSVDNTYFANLGCFSDPACLPDDLQNLPAPIDYISEPGDMLGGLDPALPLAVASTRGFTPEEEIQSVYVNRCMTQQYVRYVIYVDNQIRLVDSVQGLAATYAPIESPEEALSYAIAATGLSANYELDDGPKIKLYADSIEETFVNETSDGYVVHLFHSYLCGCGPHIVKSVDVSVGYDGTINLSTPTDAYSDPKLDGLCID